MPSYSQRLRHLSSVYHQTFAEGTVSAGIHSYYGNVEIGITAARGRDGSGDFGVSFSTGDLQVEQNRTPLVQFHQPELAGQAADQSRGHYHSHPATTSKTGLAVRCDLDSNT